MLTLKASGVEDVHGFRWLEAPERRALDLAEGLLKDLGALDRASGSITPLGRRMLAYPVHPRYARMLIAAREWPGMSKDGITWMWRAWAARTIST